MANECHNLHGPKFTAVYFLPEQSMAGRLITYKFTVEDYHRMAEAGILSEDDRVELIEGEIVNMSPIDSTHAACVKRLLRIFFRAVGERAIVSVQDPIRLGKHSEPQPDITLLLPREDFYGAFHPGPADVLLVVEVIETSAEYDREVKVPLYARFGIREVWLVDLERKHVEVYHSPAPGGYEKKTIYKCEESLSPAAFPELTIPVSEIFVPKK